MDFPQWEPHYERIVRELGLSQAEDEASAIRLSQLCRDKQICGPACLQRLMGKEVTILGDGPSLDSSLLRSDLQGTVITADGATSKLLHIVGRIPDIIVTDLDGDVADQMSANAQGSVLVVLAHGDNVDKVERFVPWFSGPLTPTTQSRPFAGVFNFGGFTDGDRAVILARHFGAHIIHLLGFDMENPRPKAGRDRSMKQRKLNIAREMIWDLNPPDVTLDGSMS